MAIEKIHLKRPWEPVKGESAGAYAAFCLYRDLGPGRSVADVIREMEAMGERVTKDSVYKWSNTFEWDSRVLKWEADIQHVRANNELREAKRSVIRLQREKERRIDATLVCADQLTLKALEMLNYPLERCVKVTEEKGPNGELITVHRHYEPNKWGMRDSAIMLRTALAMQQIALFKDDKHTLDTSGETLDAAGDRLSAWRTEMAGAIEGFSDSPPTGSLTNPLEGDSGAD
jgi:hypothetical protein